MGCVTSKDKKKIVPKKAAAASEDDITPQIYGGATSYSTNDSVASSAQKRQVVKAKKKEIEIVAVETDAKQHGQYYVDLCQWSPKSDLFLTASSAKRGAFLWNARDLKKLDTTQLSEDSAPVSCLDWAENGKLFALGSESGRVSIWTQHGKLIQSWQAHGSSGATSVKINGDLVCSGADDVCVYSVSQKKARLTCWNQTEVTAMAWIDEKTYIIGEASGLITIDEANLGNFRTLEDYDDEDFIPASEPLRSLEKGHSGGIYKICTNPEKRILASASVDCTVCIWNQEDFRLKHRLSDHLGYVIDILWLPSSKGSLASASSDGTVKIWDTDKAECLLTLQEGLLGSINSISVSKSGRHIASAGHDGLVYFWNVSSGELVCKHESSGRIMAASFNSSNNKFALASYGTVTLLELSFHGS